jgi:hypothetical protein
MPKRAAIELLPEEARKKVNQLLIDSNFAGYDQLADQINGLLQDYDLELQISRSAIHRYGKDFQQRCEALRIATEQAKAIVQNAPDEAGDMGEALTRLAQEQIFTLLVDLQGDMTAGDLSKVATAIATMNRSSVAIKKYAADVREKVEAKFKALEVESASGASKRTIDPETLRIIRQEVYGLV